MSTKFIFFIPVVDHFANNLLQNELTNGYTRSKLIYKWYTFAFLLFTFLFPVTCNLFSAHAQLPPIDVATVYPIADDQAQNGDIVFYSEKGIIRSDSSYSNKIFGILQDKPLLVYKTIDEQGKPVIRSGVAEVNVTNAGGAIKTGDYITSSATPGKGQKATISGYIIGTALADFDSPEGQIPVAIRIEYAELTNTKSVLRLLDAFNIAAFQNIKNPDQASQFLKYLTAGFFIIGSLLLSFLVFARSMSKTIEAIGRNPLAKRTLQLSIAIQAGLTVLTILIGLLAGFFITRL